MNKLGRYVLFFFAPIPKEALEFVERQLQDHNCSLCSKRETCSFKKGNFPVKPIGVYDEDNISEMNGFIRHVYEQHISEFAILVDTKSDKLYLYIGGEDWKVNLDNILYYSESLLEKIFNTENVVDLRDTLKFNAIPGVN